MRDTAPALQSITKHNHMARAGEEGCFDSEQRIQGWGWGWGFPNMDSGPESWVAQAPHWPSCPPFTHKQSLPRSRTLSEEPPGWRTKLLDGVSRRPEAYTAHKHRMPDSIGKGNCALKGLSPCSLVRRLQEGVGGQGNLPHHRHTKTSTFRVPHQEEYVRDAWDQN